MTALLCCSTEALRENLLIQGRLLNWNFTQVLQEQQALHNGANIFIKSESNIYTPVESLDQSCSVSEKTFDLTVTRHNTVLETKM